MPLDPTKQVAPDTTNPVQPQDAIATGSTVNPDQVKTTPVPNDTLSASVTPKNITIGGATTTQGQGGLTDLQYKGIQAINKGNLDKGLTQGQSIDQMKSQPGYEAAKAAYGMPATPSVTPETIIKNENAIAAQTNQVYNPTTGQFEAKPQEVKSTPAVPATGTYHEPTLPVGTTQNQGGLTDVQAKGIQSIYQQKIASGMTPQQAMEAIQNEPGFDKAKAAFYSTSTGTGTTVGTGTTGGVTAGATTGTTTGTTAAPGATEQKATGDIGTTPGQIPANVKSIIDSLDNGTMTPDQRKQLEGLLTSVDPVSGMITAKYTADVAATTAKQLLSDMNLARDTSRALSEKQAAYDAQVADIKREAALGMQKQLDNIKSTENNMSIILGTGGRLQSQKANAAAEAAIRQQNDIYNNMVASRDSTLAQLAAQFHSAKTTIENNYTDQMNQARQDMLNTFASLDKTGAINTVNGLQQAQNALQKLLQTNVANTTNYANTLKILNDSYVAQHQKELEAKTPNVEQTKLANDGFMRNDLGNIIRDSSGQPMAYNRTKTLEKTVQDPSTGDTIAFYQDGTHETLFHGTPATQQMVNGYINMIKLDPTKAQSVIESLKGNPQLQTAVLAALQNANIQAKPKLTTVYDENGERTTVWQYPDGTTAPYHVGETSPGQTGTPTTSGSTTGRLSTQSTDLLNKLDPTGTLAKRMNILAAIEGGGPGMANADSHGTVAKGIFQINGGSEKATADKYNAALAKGQAYMKANGIDVSNLNNLTQEQQDVIAHIGYLSERNIGGGKNGLSAMLDPNMTDQQFANIEHKIQGSVTTPEQVMSKINSLSQASTTLGAATPAELALFDQGAKSIGKGAGKLSEQRYNEIADQIKSQKGVSDYTGPIDTGSGAPITYARRIKSMVPATLMNSEIELKNLNDTIGSLYKSGTTPEDAALMYMGVDLKPDKKEAGMKMIDMLKGSNAQPQVYTAVADELNKGNSKGAVTLLENTLYKDRGVKTEDISEIGNNIKNGDNLVARINTLKNKFGPISGNESKWAQYVKDDKDTQRLLSDMTNFVAKYRNGIAGTSVTTNEEDFLNNIIPTITNNPDNAIAKIQSNTSQAFNGLNTIRDTVGLPTLQDPRSSYDINFRQQAYTGRGTTSSSGTPVKTATGKTYKDYFTK